MFQNSASLEDLLGTVARLESRFAFTGTEPAPELWSAYQRLVPRFELDLGASARDVALAKASALMLIQGCLHAKTGT